MLLIADLHGALALCLHDEARGVGGLLHLKFMGGTGRPSDVTDNTLEFRTRGARSVQARVLGNSSKRDEIQARILAHALPPTDAGEPSASLVDLIQADLADGKIALRDANDAPNRIASRVLSTLRRPRLDLRTGLICAPRPRRAARRLEPETRRALEPARSDSSRFSFTPRRFIVKLSCCMRIALALAVVRSCRVRERASSPRAPGGGGSRAGIGNSMRRTATIRSASCKVSSPRPRPAPAPAVRRARPAAAAARRPRLRARRTDRARMMPSVLVLGRRPSLAGQGSDHQTERRAP